MNSLIKRELHPTTFSPLLSTTALALILSACGGGGGGGGSSAPTPTSISGRLFDGPISGAKIYIDIDNDGELDKDIDLLIDTTDSKGAYDIPIAHANKKLIADLTGAVDIGPDLDINDDSDNEDVSGIWLAPAGSKVISPLTHYLSKGGDVTILENLTSDEIKTRDPFDGQANDDIDNRIKTLAKIVATELGDDDNFDNAGALNIGTLQTAITAGITSANDAPTAMNLSRSSHVVAENTATKTHLATITFIDADGLGENAITLNNDTLFEIENTSRLVKNLYLQAGQTLDYETDESIEVTLTGPGTLEKTFTLNIGALNDEAPQLRIAKNSSNLRIGAPAEATDTGLTFTLTDADGKSDNDTGPTLSGTGSEKFDIVATDSNDLTDGRGYKIVAKPLQTFISTDSFTLTVTYSDGKQSDVIEFAAFSPAAAVTTPDIAGGATATYNIDEDVNSNIIASLSATGGGITWSITDGADRASFSLTPAGVLTFTGTLDQDLPTSKSSYTVIVTASNNAQTGATTDTQTITLNIANIDEGDAVFSLSGTARDGERLTIAETTEDPDGKIGNYNYQWYKYKLAEGTASPDSDTKIGTNNNRYRIVEADEGYSIYAVISYRDNSNKDVNDAGMNEMVISPISSRVPIAPAITAGLPSRVTIQEDDDKDNDSNNHIRVPITLTTSKGDTPITWSVSDTTNFQINATTGALHFIGASDQDASTPNPSVYNNIRITATSNNNNNLTDTHIIAVTIEDIDDEDPTLSNGGDANTIHGGSNGQNEYAKRETGFHIDLVDPDTILPNDYTPAIAVSIDSTPNTAAADAFALERDNSNIPTGALMRYKLVINAGQRLLSGKTYLLTISQPDLDPWAGSTTTRSENETLSFTTEDNTAAQINVTARISNADNGADVNIGDVIIATASITDSNGIDPAATKYQFFKTNPDGTNRVSLGDPSTSNRHTIHARDGFTDNQKVLVIVTFTDRGGATETANPVLTEQGFGDGFYAETTLGTAGDDTTLLDRSSATTSQLIKGLAGNDVLKGGSVNDRLEGGSGHDTLQGGRGSDILDGGPGIDTADFSYKAIIGNQNISVNIANNSVLVYNGIYVDLGGISGNAYHTSDRDKLSAIENVIGSAHADIVLGNSDANHLKGGEGRDNLVGDGGDDILEAGAGANEWLFGMAGNDTFVLGVRGGGYDQVFDFSYGSNSGHHVGTAGGNDKIRVDVSDADLNTINAENTAAEKLATLKNLAHLRWTNDSEFVIQTDGNSRSNSPDTVIYDTNNSLSDTSDDEILIVLQDFSTDLTIDMFDII